MAKHADLASEAFSKRGKFERQLTWNTVRHVELIQIPVPACNARLAMQTSTTSSQRPKTTPRADTTDCVAPST
jgi:hypothetical protein